MRGWGWRRAGIVVAAVAAVVAAGPATSALAGEPRALVYVSGTDLVFLDAKGEADAVIIRPVLVGPITVAYDIESDAPLDAGPGCSVVPVSWPEATCSPEGVANLYAALGDGDDILHDYTGLVATLHGDDGNDTIHRWAGSAGAGVLDLVDGGPGDDDLWAGTRPARLAGGTGNDVLFGGGADDVLSGGPGSDRLDGGAGADEMGGGDGYDVVTYESHTVAVKAGLDGSAGDDGAAGEGDTVGPDIEALVGGSAGDYLYGAAGNDWLDGSTGNDTLVGNGGDDALLGDAGDDWLDGGPGRDWLTGGAGDDYLFGGAHDDDLEGGPGSDRLHGGSGLDRCRPGDSEPVLDCET